MAKTGQNWPKMAKNGQKWPKMAVIETFTYSSMADTIVTKFKSLVDLHTNLFTKIGQIRESRESGLTCHKPSHGMKLLLQTCKYYWVSSIEYQVLNIKYWIFKYWVSSIEYQVLSTKYWVSSIEYQVLSTKYQLSSIEYQALSIKYTV